MLNRISVDIQSRRKRHGPRFFYLSLFLCRTHVVLVEVVEEEEELMRRNVGRFLPLFLLSVLLLEHCIGRGKWKYEERRYCLAAVVRSSESRIGRRVCVISRYVMSDDRPVYKFIDSAYSSRSSRLL